jgi:endonuclease/exonuclease/phosphatase family metal-dependent hydrolase
MAWNVHGFRAGWRRVAEVAEAEAPDVLLLNEAGYVGWRVRRLARRLGMELVAGARLRGHRVPNAVLARSPWRIVSTRRTRLPRTTRTIPRGMVVAEVGRAGRRLTVVAVHLGLVDAERGEHVRVLTDSLAASPHPVVIGGDLNEGPEGPAARWLAERYWDAFATAGEGDGFTFPASDPRARIDFVFVSEGVVVRSAGLSPASSRASDHLAVVAVLGLD